MGRSARPDQAFLASATSDPWVVRRTLGGGVGHRTGPVERSLNAHGRIDHGLAWYCARPKEIRMPLAEFPSRGDAGPQVFVEVDAPIGQGAVRVSKEGVLIRATQSFEDALATMRAIAGGVLKTVGELAPQQAEVEMGFKLSAESGVVIAKASGEAHVRLKFVWNKEGSIKEG